MTRIAPVPPAETDLLCEFCGYTLNGLNEQSNCPECGMPIRSSLGTTRHPPAWEQPDRALASTFIATTWRIIFHTKDFFKGMTTRGDVRNAALFAHLHWAIASALFGLAASAHANLFNQTGNPLTKLIFTGAIGVIVFAIISYFSLWATTWMAVRLTTWEAAYRGYRLPLPVVMRGMYYHAAHYLPVGLAAAATVVGYVSLLRFRVVNEMTLTTYLYVLCGEIIVAAFYLFETYWIGMRNMMYANR
jgi:hypothetical protein